MDDLHWCAAIRRERGTQRLMTSINLRQREVDGANVQRSLDPGGDRRVVRRAARLPLIQEPESLLTKRQWGIRLG